MTLVDTSVWVDHFRRRNQTLSELLGAGQVSCHPFVIGEPACGNLQQRSVILGLMGNLPTASMAEHHEAPMSAESIRPRRPPPPISLKVSCCSPSYTVLALEFPRSASTLGSMSHVCK